MLGKRQDPDLEIGYWSLPDGLDDWMMIHQTPDNVVHAFSAVSTHLKMRLPAKITQVFADNTFLMGGIRYQFVQRHGTLFDSFSAIDGWDFSEVGVVPAAPLANSEIVHWKRKFHDTKKFEIPGANLLDVIDCDDLYAIYVIGNELCFYEITK